MATELASGVTLMAESDGSIRKGLGQNEDQDHEHLIVERTQDPMNGSELHFDVDKGDMLFDYGTEEITATPDMIGEHISQILESVLPTGVQRDTRGKLQVADSDNQSAKPADSESFLELQNAMGNLQRIQKVKQLSRHIPDCRKTSESDVSEISLRACKHNENSLSNRPDRPSRPNKPSRPPNFSVLIKEKRPVCLFCEYCMVFGEPPRNMIKWYNKVNRYNNLPKEGERKDRHSRKKSH